MTDTAMASGNAAAATNPVSALLEAVGSAADVRRAIASRYQGIDPAALDEVYIYGAGQDSRDVIRQCLANGIGIAGVLDDNPARSGEVFEGYPIQSTQAVAAAGPRCPVVITTHRVTPATINLKRLGISAQIPAWALQILAPERFPPHMYYAGWAEDLAANKARYAALWDVFTSAESRRVLLAFMTFKLRFDPLALADIIDAAGEYFPSGVIHLTDQEIFLDGGAWTGDTVRELERRSGGRFRKIYAFEPNPDPFKALSQAFAGDDRVVPVNKGMYSRSTVLRFDDFGNTASRLSDTGGIEVPVAAIDETVGDEPVSFIKMNIEGAEAEALKGARRTIREHRPKLAICLYHNPRDLWELPALVEEISPGYDFHLRLHDGGVIQLVMYAVPK